MSIIKHVTLQKIVAHDFRYDPRTITRQSRRASLTLKRAVHTEIIALYWVRGYKKQRKCSVTIDSISLTSVKSLQYRVGGNSKVQQLIIQTKKQLDVYSHAPQYKR